MRRWRGLVELVQDGLVAGTHALERAQKDTAALPFAVLEALPAVRVPARAVHEAYDATVSLVYAAVRVGGQTICHGGDAALAALDPHAKRRAYGTRSQASPSPSPSESACAGSATRGQMSQASPGASERA